LAQSAIPDRVQILYCSEMQRWANIGQRLPLF